MPTNNSSAIVEFVRPLAASRITRRSEGVSDPAAHTIASATFDLPEPFGPTTTATPGSSLSSIGSTNDLKPRSFTARRCTEGT